MLKILHGTLVDNKVTNRAALPRIARSSCMKMLGVSIGNDLTPLDVLTDRGQSTRPAVGDVECTGAVRITHPADPRTGRRSSAACVPCYRHRPSDVCRQRVGWSHQGVRLTTHQLCDRRRPAPRILSTRLADIR